MRHPLVVAAGQCPWCARFCAITFLLVLLFPDRSAGQTLVLDLPGGAKMEFIWVPATASGNKKEIKIGDFANPQGKEPVHKEILWGPFEQQGKGWGYFLGKTEVSERQWKSVMGEGGDSLRPAVGHSFEDIQKFVQKIGAAAHAGSVKGLPRKQDGSEGVIKLPSEGEWEYAARGGSGPDYEKAHPYGSERDIERFEVVASPGSDGQVRDVGSLPPNVLGLHDMLGNVREFVEGSYSGGGRILKGGSFLSEPREIRSAARTEQRPSEGRPDAGFRLCISALEVTKLGQTSIPVDYLPSEDDPKAAEDLKRAVALAGTAFQAQELILKARRNIEAFERNLSSVGGLQGMASEKIATNRKVMEKNQAAFDKAIGDLRALPKQVRLEAIEAVKEQCSEQGGGPQQEASIAVLAERVLSDQDR